MLMYARFLYLYGSLKALKFNGNQKVIEKQLARATRIELKIKEITIYKPARTSTNKQY